MSTAETIPRVPIRRSTIRWGGLIVAAQAFALLAYYTFTPNELVGVTPLLPVVWITVGLWALVRTDPPDAASERHKILALALGTGYFAVLAWFGGLWGPANPTLPAFAVEGALLELPPGWNPRFYLNTPIVEVHILPYQFVGYAGLAYLVYSRTLEVSGALVSGVLGLVSCVSCTWPVFAAILGGVTGGAAGFYSTAVGLSYPIATVVFVVTVALLSWTPDWG